MWYFLMMANCFCGMVDRRKAFSLISSRDYCQRSSSSRISDTPRAGFEPAQNLSSGFVEWSCAVVIRSVCESVWFVGRQEYQRNILWSVLFSLISVICQNKKSDCLITLYPEDTLYLLPVKTPRGNVTKWQVTNTHFNREFCIFLDIVYCL